VIKAPLRLYNSTMPSRASKPKKPKQAPSDPVLFAKAVMENIIGEKWDRSKPELERIKNPHAVALSKLGASKGGKARAENLTAKQRSKIAKKAAKARWKKRPEAA
jgi:hypothetical protein